MPSDNYYVLNETDVYGLSNKISILFVSTSETTVKYSVTFYFPLVGGSAAMYNFYNLYTSSLTVAVVSGFSFKLYATHCDGVCGTSFSVPFFSEPYLLSSFLPTMSPTVVPSVTRMPTPAAVIPTFLQTATGGAVVAGAIVLFLLAIAATIALRSFCSKRTKASEKQLEEWLDSETGDIDIHKQTQLLREDFLRGSINMDILDVYAKINHDEVLPAVFNPARTSQQGPRTEAEQASAILSSDVEDSKRALLKNFATSLQVSRTSKEKAVVAEPPQVMSMVDLFRDIKTSMYEGDDMSSADGSGVVGDEREMAQVLKKFHQELQEFRDKVPAAGAARPVVDPIVAPTPGQSEGGRESDIEILDLFADANPYYTDV